MKMIESSKERRIRLKAEGLCISCAEKMDRKGSYCSKCLEYRRADDRIRRAERMKNGLCPKCGKPKEPGRHVNCAECRKYYRVLYGPHETETMRNKRKAWINAGLCGICGKNKPKEGRKTCEQCLEKQKIRDKRRYVARLGNKEGGY